MFQQFLRRAATNSAHHQRRTAALLLGSGLTVGTLTWQSTLWTRPAQVNS